MVLTPRPEEDHRRAAGDSVRHQVVSGPTLLERTSPTNEDHPAGLNSRAGPLGSFESRTAIRPQAAITWATSTQLLPEPPLYDDLYQASSGASSEAVM
ncbi:hypothetical protein GCM10009574_036080 [Streptomyces asiaticus]|uniref:Uncharacterized protein n=2 Tax=Streptomyces rhizosphaericus TaxID=114699 RepID=A0ABN1PNQ8_9ACTN